MQNAFLQKVQMSLTDDTLSLAQTSSVPGEALIEGLDLSLKNIYETKFVIFATEWSVIDWTIFCIVLAIIIIAVVIGLLFCCCVGSTQPEELQAAREKAEKEAMDKDFMEYKAGENALAGLGASGEADAPSAPADPPMEEAM